jgi:uncharacterized lipoprotein
MEFRTVVLVSAVVLLAGCGSLSGDTTPTPDMEDPESTVESPTPDETDSPTQTPEPTVSDTPAEDGPTDTPTDAPDTETPTATEWPPYEFGAATGDTGGSYEQSTEEEPSASAGGSGNVSAK